MTAYQEDDMKRLILSAALVGGLVLAWSMGRVQGQSGNDNDKVAFVEASKANFTAMPGGSGGVTAAPIRGDATAGAFAAFTKFPPGYDAGWHTHTNAVSLV